MDQEYYIKKWLNGTLTPEERDLFEKTEDFKELNRIDQALADFKAPKLDQNAAFQKLQSAKPNAKPDAKHIELPRKTSWLRIAAILVPLLAIIFIWSQNRANLETVVADQQQVEHALPDQSQIVLNAQSSISYHAKAWGKKRSLNLNGEAYFKVTSGASFSVFTEEGLVTVLGTEFNVKNRENYYEVICYEGKVQVTTSENQRILTAGQMFRVIDGTMIFDKDISSVEPSWINKISSFVSIPYNQVLAELERQYQIEVISEDIDLNQLFTGSFSHENLELAVQSITQPLNLSYSITDHKTVILEFESN